MSTAAERQRRYRRRKAMGERIAKVVLTQDLLETLIDAGYLPAWDAEDNEAQEQALSKLLARLKVL